MDSICENLEKVMGYVPKKKEVVEKLIGKYGNEEANKIMKNLFTLDIRDPLFLSAWEELLEAVAPGKSRNRG